MRTNHESVLAYIRRAIAECREDSALADARRYLHGAMEAVERVGKKRSSRESQAQSFRDAATKKNEDWIKRLKDGLKVNPEDSNDKE